MVWVMSVTSESPVLAPAPGRCLGSREQLLAEITAAVRPGVSPRAFVLLAFDGFRDFADRVGQLESRTLLHDLVARLEESVSPAGACFRAREDEFAVLCDAEPTTLEPLLEHAAEMLREPGAHANVALAWGSVVLPDEASDPATALRLADERLGANRPMRRAGRSPGASPAADPLAVRTRHVDGLLDIAATLSQLAEAVRVDESDQASGRLRGGPREPARIPLLIRKLGLSLAALQAFGGPEIAAASEIAASPNAHYSQLAPKVIVALDQIGLILSGGSTN